LKSEKPLDRVKADLVAQLGTYDGEKVQAALSSDDPSTSRPVIERMAGPDGLMLFGMLDHGTMLRVVGRPARAVQYTLGNPLVAAEMTRNALGAGLYAPVRVLVYEAEDGRTCIEYDRPSSQFGQFGDKQVLRIATELDEKLERLVNTATR
jgi:uncharacterized protein (DUF302 family)